jgi:hypothetical protein
MSYEVFWSVWSEQALFLVLHGHWALFPPMVSKVGTVSFLVAIVSKIITAERCQTVVALEGKNCTEKGNNSVNI